MLDRNQQADSYHAAGLRAIKDEQYGKAATELTDALDVLDQHGPSVDPAPALQYARVESLLGMTLARLGIEGVSIPEGSEEPITRTKKQLDLLQTAEQRIEAAIATTDPVESPLLSRDRLMRLFPERRERRAVLREVQAEHGAILGIMARYVTLMAVMGSRGVQVEDRHNLMEATKYFVAANRTLRFGANGYYWVSNLMNWLREDAIFNGWIGKRKLLGELAIARAWTWLFDHKNWDAAQRTYKDRRNDFRSRGMALQRLFEKP